MATYTLCDIKPAFQNNKKEKKKIYKKLFDSKTVAIIVWLEVGGQRLSSAIFQKMEKSALIWRNNVLIVVIYW